MAVFLSRPATAPASSSYEITDHGNTNMKVVVRMRPENEAEICSSSRTVAKVMDEHVLVFDPSPDNAPTFYQELALGPLRRPLLGKKHRDLRFAFDRVFDETASQVEVFEHTTKAIIDGVLDGINCSVFAYGATGAGKTYTMLGNLENPGVMFLTMMELYRRITDLQDEKTCQVAVSYCEVYNETICDLLAPSGSLELREDSQKGLVVSGLTQHQPQTANEILNMLEIGNKNRTQHPTDANATSSRSHAVFQVFVHQKARTAGLSAEVTCAKMSLIDLAGSERATVTTNRGQRLREGANINKSLLALGNCINALADSNKSKTVHVPYRNSKLTRLLKDSLGGNCRTVMIANISPSGMTYEDTYNTLKYADRAKQIKAKLVRNVLNVDFHLTKYRTIVQDLQKEIAELKSKLEKKTPKRLSFDTTEATRLQGLVQSVYGERSRLRKHMADLDASERETLLKICRKERDVQRIDTLSDNEAKKAKICARVESLRKHVTEIQRQKQTVHEYIFSNNESIGRIQAEINTSVSGCSASPALRHLMEIVTEAKKLEAENAHQWKQTKHLLKYIKNQEKEISRTEKILVLSLQLVRKQHTMLRASNTLTSSLQEMYEGLVRTAEGDKGVAWADQSMDESAIFQSQQKLFESFIASASPASKSTNRKSSPSIAASLGILTTTATVSVNSGEASDPVTTTRSARNESLHPLAIRKPTTNTPVPSPQVHSGERPSRLLKTFSPFRIPDKPRVPTPDTSLSSSTSCSTYNTRLNTVLNSNCTKPSPIALKRSISTSTSSSSSVQRTEPQPYTLPRPRPELRHKMSISAGDLTETRRYESVDFFPPPNFQRFSHPSATTVIPRPVDFNPFDDNFVSPRFAHRPLPKTPVPSFMKGSPSLQNLHPNPNHMALPMQPVGVAPPALLCRPLPSPSPAFVSSGQSGLRHQQKSSSLHSLHTASVQGVTKSSNPPGIHHSSRPPTSAFATIPTVTRVPFTTSAFTPRVAFHQAPPCQNVFHPPMTTGDNSTPHSSPVIDERRKSSPAAMATDLNSTYTVSDRDARAVSSGPEERRRPSGPTSLLTLLHVNSPKAMEERHRTSDKGQTKKTPTYLQLTKSAASKRVLRLHNKENEPASGGKPAAKTKRFQRMRSRVASAPQPSW